MRLLPRWLGVPSKNRQRSVQDVSITRGSVFLQMSGVSSQVKVPRRGSKAQPPDSKSVTLSIELRGRAKNVENTFKWKYISGSQILPESYQQKCLTVRAKQHVSPRLLPASQLSFLHFEKAMNALPARLTLKITLCYTAKNPIQIEGKSDVIKRRRHNLCTTEKGVGLYIED